MPDRDPREQDISARARRGVTPALCLLVVALLLPLAACGKKPSHVDPPQGEDADTFPLVYPDPATDPPPESP